MSRIALVLSLLIGATAAATAPPAPNAVESATHTVWSKLNGSANTCAGFDYFPRGGLRSLGCHVFGLVSLESINAIMPMPLFLSGPHEKNQLSLNHTSEFGHYNPKAIGWIVSNALPETRGDAMQKSTQATYDQSLKPLVHALYLSHQKLKANPECTQLMVQDLGLSIDSKAHFDVEQYYNFMSESNCQNLFNRETKAAQNAKPLTQVSTSVTNGNVVKSSVAFWLRRSIDGSEKSMGNALESLIRVYEPELLKQGHPLK